MSDVAELKARLTTRPPKTEQELAAFYERYAKLRSISPPGVSLADELIAERRAEAERSWNS